MTGEGRRKPYAERRLASPTKSRRWRAGSRRNKRLRDVGSFGSDSKAARR